MVAVQRIRREEEEGISLAIKYYSIISILNNLRLSKRHIQLLAFTAIRGTITPLAARKEFIDMFDSSLPSIENMKGKLHKMGLLVKDKDMYRVNPRVLPDLSQDRLVMQIDMNLKKEEGNGNLSERESE